MRIEYFRKSITSRRLKEYGTPHSEIICSEIGDSKKKWLCISDSSFEELNISVSKAHAL